MADFLTRLAGRALGVVPSVQPMIASMFTPGSVLFSGQTGVFEKAVSGGEPGQASFWSAGRDSGSLSVRGQLQESAAAERPERGVSIIAGPLSFSLRHDTVFPQVADQRARAAESAMPGISGNITVNRQNRPSSMFVADQGSHLDKDNSLSSCAIGAGSLSGATHNMPLPSMFASSDESLPGADLPLSSKFVTGERGLAGASQNISLASPTASLLTPDKTGPLPTREMQALPAESAQRQPGRASSIAQDYQGNDVPHTVMNVNMSHHERQQIVGNVHQSTVSENSHFQASLRQTADAVVNRYELSLEGTAPTTTPVPTIQVTIGRIEVRATQPRLPQRQAPRPEARMVNLEEYLNQQAKGGQ